MKLHLGLSVYAQSLPDGAKKRYKEKISIIHGLDPFGSGLGEAVPTAGTTCRSERFGGVSGVADELHHSAGAFTTNEV